VQVPEKAKWSAEIEAARFEEYTHDSAAARARLADATIRWKHNWKVSAANARTAAPSFDGATMRCRS
jgi:hypothetical protein